MKIVEILIEFQAGVNAQDTAGTTPLHRASENGNDQASTSNHKLCIDCVLILI